MKNMNKNNKQTEKFTGKGKESKRTNSKTDQKVETREKYGNHPSWYYSDKALLDSAGSIAFNQVMGLKNNLFTPPEGDGAIINNMPVLPGIALMHLIPTLGRSVSQTDAPTVAARKIYSFVRHANSGSSNYEAPDLLMMIVAHCSAQAWLSNLRRVYGCLQLFHTMNRYYGKALVNAMGFDYDDLSTNMADFRTFINLSAAKLNAIKIPSGIPLAERWNWLSSNIFCDDDSIKAQLYVPKFITYFQFSGTTDAGGSELLSKDLGDGTLAGIKAFTNALIDPLFGSEDIGIMSGDIMKAYGTNVSSIPLLDVDYVTYPLYDKDVLMQIHNSNPMFITQPHTHHVTQNAEGAIVEEIYTSTTATTRYSKALSQYRDLFLDMYSDTVTPEQVMVATRLRATGFWHEDIDDMFEFDTYGTEILAVMVIYSLNPNRPEGYFAIQCPCAIGTAGEASQISMFNWHPITYTLFTDDNDQINWSGIVGDIENCTTLSNQTLTTLHNVAVLNELAVSTAQTKI